MQYEVAGRQLKCPHCGGIHFKSGTAQMNTAGMSFLGLDWLNESAQTFMCMACGRIEWFVPGVRPKSETKAVKEECPVEKEEPVTDYLDIESDCLACDSKIPADQDKCPECGWSYKVN